MELYILQFISFSSLIFLAYTKIAVTNSPGALLCRVHKCDNEALCVPSITHKVAYVCECPRGWEGEYCSTESDYDKQEGEEVPCIADKPKGAFSASSSLNTKFSPEMSKLNTTTSWIAGYSTSNNLDVIFSNIKLESTRRNKDIDKLSVDLVPQMQPIGSRLDADHFLEIKFDMVRKMHRVETQGSPILPFWVTSYKIAYTMDAERWFMMYDVATRKEKVFMANIDQNSPVTNHVPGHRVARYVRLYPQSWNGYIALRWEIYGCGGCWPSCINGICNHRSGRCECDPGWGGNACDELLYFDCNEHNPCSPRLHTAGQRRYKHRENNKFVQCSRYGHCAVRKCSRGGRRGHTGTCKERTLTG